MSMLTMARGRGLRGRGGEASEGGGEAIEDGWSVHKNFDSGTLGTDANGTADGFDDAAGDSVYTNEQVYAGGQAVKCTVLNGAEDFGTWGGVVDFPSTVAKGGNLWLRLYIWMPENPDFIIETPGNGSLKYIRISQKKADTTNAGYFDLQFQDDDKTVSEFRMLKEVQNMWQNFGADGSFPRGQWVEHVLHMVLDDVLPASGGNSRIRFWQDGVLMVDSGTVNTIINATDYADSLYLFTYWNGGAPQTQSLYVDEITVSSHTLPAWAVGYT